MIAAYRRSGADLPCGDPRRYQAVRDGWLGQIEPVAMKRSQNILDRERAIVKARGRLRCDGRGVPAAA